MIATVTSVSHHVGHYTIRAQLTREYIVDFEVFAPLSVDAPRLYARKGATNSWDNPTENLDEAERVAYGGVKFDGCTNLIVQEGDDTMVHTCSLSGFLGLLEAVAEARKLAASLLSPEDPANVEYAAKS